MIGVSAFQSFDPSIVLERGNPKPSRADSPDVRPAFPTRSTKAPAGVPEHLVRQSRHLRSRTGRPANPFDEGGVLPAFSPPLR